MGVTQLVFELFSLKAKIRDVSNRLYCCYDNLLSEKNFLQLVHERIGHLFDSTTVPTHKDW